MSPSKETKPYSNISKSLTIPKDEKPDILEYLHTDTKVPCLALKFL